MEVKPVRNIVVLLTDALRFDHVNENITPHLMRIARDGIFYTNVTSPGSYTPSVMPFYLSGRKHYDPEYGLPRRLSGLGYYTCLINTNLVVKFRFEKGWNEVHYLPDFTPSPIKETAQHSHSKHSSFRAQLKKWLPLPLALFLSTMFAYLTFEFPYCPADELLAFASKRLATLEKPNFTWIHLMDAHEPYFPQRSGHPPAYLKHYVIKYNQHQSGRRSLKSNEIHTLRMLYALNIREMDEAIGGFYDTLPKDNTLLFILSDHGECFGEHGLMGHPQNRLIPPLQHVPLIVVGNGTGIVHDRINLIDFPSFVFEQLGI